MFFFCEELKVKAELFGFFAKEQKAPFFAKSSSVTVKPPFFGGRAFMTFLLLVLERKNENHKIPVVHCQQFCQHNRKPHGKGV